jgi:hypothetical protein
LRIVEHGKKDRKILALDVILIKRQVKIIRRCRLNIF